MRRPSEIHGRDEAAADCRTPMVRTVFTDPEPPSAEYPSPDTPEPTYTQTMSGYDRWNQRASGRRSPTGGLLFGVIVIAVGAVMLLDNLGLIRSRDLWDYAPLLLVVFGVGKLLESHARPTAWIFGGLLCAVGTLWFLENINLLQFDSRLIWPVLIIGFGVLSLVRAIERQRSPINCEALPSSQSQMNAWAVFGGSKRIVDTRDFRSGDLFALFGGVDLDLRPAGILQTAVVDANAVFGGIEIHVPPDWMVEVRGSGIFGGYEDKTLHPAPEPGLSSPKLIVTGFAVFGGVSVSNV